MLISLLIVLLVAAIAYGIASLFLPPPIPAIVFAVILVAWLAERHALD